jgi:Tol biopolymer transport system component
VLLASSEQRILDPALSPDGRMIAYVGEDQSRRLDLFVAQIPGGGRIRLTDDAAAEGWPRFSPDGQRVAFTRQEGGITSVYVTSAFGGAMVKVVTTASEPSWSRDGTRLAFVYRPNRGQPPAVATSLADGSDVRILFTAEHADPFIRNTSWSADGQLIAFVLSSGGTAGAVWTIPAGGGAPRRLTSDPVGVFSAEPVFTPDGRHLVLSSNRGGATNLWSVPVGGGAPVRLTTGPGPDVSPSVAADGAVAFLNSRWRNALMVVDLERGQSRTVLTHSPYLWAPTMSPDGALIAFSRGETGGLWHIWTVPSQGGDARQLTFGDKGEIYPRFTPDGSTVVYHTWGDPHRIWKVALAGGPPAAVTPEGAPDEAWADVSPDGRWLAFVRVEAGVERTHIAPIGGGASRLLTTTPATTPRWSPDGARLAFSHNRSYGGGVSVIDADGRDERRLSDTGGWPVWWPDGRSLAMLTVGGRGDQEVQLIDLAGRPLAARAWPRFAGTNQLFDVLRGGSAIVTALAVHQSDEIWLLRR